MAVVGGGIAGVSVALAAARRGASVILVEQNSLTSGTTWHAAGLMGTLKGSTMQMRLTRYAVELYRELNDETGASTVGWTNCGSLALARCSDSMEGLVRNVQMAHGIGITHHRVVTPEEIAAIHPFLKLEGVVGGVYSPEDGFVNPADVTMWMAREARSHGAQLLENTECAEVHFDTAGEKVTGLRTAAGEDIFCSHMVFCGGAWSKKLSRSAFGENRIPVAMVPHQYLIFEKIDGVGSHLPVVRDVLHKYYLKPEVGSFCLGVFEGDPKEHLPEGVRLENANEVIRSRDAKNELYQESMEKAGEWMEHAMEDVPVLNEVGVKQWLHGPDTHSTDHMPLIGRIPGTENAYLSTGFNSLGIQLGPGAGVGLTEFMLDGAPHSLGCDFSGADPSRVHPALCEDAEWVESRALEGYGKIYSIHWPGEVFESARDRRKTPLHASWEALGARFGETYGWERPLYFPTAEERRGVETPGAFSWTDTTGRSPPHGALSYCRQDAEYFAAEKRECLAAREAAVLFDLSSFGKLKVSGSRSLEVLQRCMTAEMDRGVGSVTYSLLCNRRGGVLGDLTVARLGPEDFYVVTLANQPGKVADQIRCVARQLGVGGPESFSLSDVTEANAVLAVNGPRSRAVLEPLLDGEPAMREALLDNGAFPPYTARRIRIAGVEALALRVSFAGEYGWELHLPSADAPRLLDGLLEAGEPHGLRPGGYFALLNSLRLEKGFVHYGADVSLSETPLEAGLGFACKLKPGTSDFVGKEAILAQRKAGITRRLVSVKGPLGESSAADEGISFWGHEQELLYRNGECVGKLTSGGHSHTLGCAIGLAHVQGPPKVPQQWLAEGSYEVEAFGRQADGRVVLRRVPVELSTKCLVDPEGLRGRGPAA